MDINARSSSIAVLCRGKSLANISYICNDFDECFIVGQFDNGLRKIGKYLLGKKIVQILNKCAITPDKKIYLKYGIRDLQCNFGSYYGEELSPEKKSLYKKICKLNSWAKVHLVPIGLTARRPFKKWCTTGIYAIDLACFFNPQKVIVIGMDFYHSDYFCKEKLVASIKKNRKRADEMIGNFYDIVKRDNHIKFEIYTKCRKISENFDNLKVVIV